MNLIQVFFHQVDSYEWTPENVGEFPYFDMIHPWMQGLIIVQESKGQAHSEDSCRRNSCGRNSCRRNSCGRNSCGGRNNGGRNNGGRNSCRRNSCSTNKSI